MPSGFHVWSQTAANNATADSTVNWAEGQAPSSVNDSARNEMAVLAKWRDDNNGSLTTGGTSTAYTLTTNTVFTSLALMDNQTLSFTMSATSGATPTLNVDGLGAKVIRNATGVALPTGALLSGSVYHATYENSAGEWLLHNQAGALPTSSVATASIADDAVTYAKMQNVSATSRLLGRTTAGAGDVEEISLGAGMSFSSGSLVSTLDPAVIPGFLTGLELSTAGSSATFGIAAGAANDASAGGMMALTSAYTKTTSAWAVGTGNGALDTGTIATSTWYHVFLIKRTDTSVVDVLVSTSATSPTMPTSYTLKRRIGSMKTSASSQWTRFYQVGDEFIWDVPVQDQNVSGTPAGLYALTVAPDFSVIARMNMNFRSSLVGGNVLLHSPLTGNQTQNTPSGNITAIAMVGGVDQFFQINIMTDTSRQIRASSNGTGTITFVLVTTGWNDRRGK